jgi:Pyruvate/2-oxoacid:ferredoxin oxidoreductase delta subunit
MIKVDLSKCVGCNSCSNVCPSQNITRQDTADGKRIHWKRCKEECDLCVEFCPAKALMLVPFDEGSEEPDASFDLVACKICGARYATEPMLKRIESVLPVNLQKDSTGLSWIWVCPICRRNIEAERATKQMVLGRSRKNP